jgi:hypothetical protein
MFGIINVMILAYLVFVLIVFEKSWQTTCVKKLSIWLIVYCFIQLAHIVRQIAAICIWHRAKDPALEQTKSDVAFVILIVIPEIAWYIYGYSFIFTNDTENCRAEQNSLWVCVLILLVYGMFFIVFCLGVMCFACGVYYVYISWSVNTTDSTTETEKEISNLPVVGEAIRKRRLATATTPNRISNRVSAFSISSLED